MRPSLKTGNFYRKPSAADVKSEKKSSLENGSSCTGSEVEQIATLALLYFFPHITRHKNEKK
jgi:hypothetical protein